MLEAIAGRFPSGPTRGPLRDWLAFQRGKTGQRLARLIGQARVRPHREILSAAIAEVLRLFAEPVCIETGCIRRAGEGTDSSLAIARALAGRGRFFTFELQPAHIEVCKSVCAEHLDQIEFIEGDAAANLAEYKRAGNFDKLHFAFFDSADDPAITMAEFEAVEDLFVPGSFVIVDDAVRGVKGRLIKPYLRANPSWRTRLVFAGNGMLLAQLKGDAT
ncbi:MAG TPA: hypothetical protein VM425_16495 [Myxococcota bacterium]|nr:hypothetical protein [Myxococcota bacterium]